MYKILVTTAFTRWSRSGTAASVATEVIEFNSPEEASRAIERIEGNEFTSNCDGLLQFAIALF